MKILVLADSIESSTGGGKTGILGICKTLSNYGHDVTLATLGLDSNKFVDGGIKKIATGGLKIKYFKSFFILMGTRFSLSFMIYLIRNAKNFDLILIHSLYKFSSTFGAFVAHMRSVPYIIRPHGSLDSFLINRRRSIMKRFFLYLFERRNFKNAAAIQFSCALEENKAREFIPYWKKTIIIEEGVDCPKHLVNKIKITKTNKKIELLFLGRIHQKKGLELLIQAYFKLALRYKNIHLTIAGMGELSYFQKIEGMIESFGLNNRCTLTGYLNEEERDFMFSKADIFVLPSFSENFGLAVVEAMTYSLPVIVSDNVGIYEAIKNNGAGLVVKTEVHEIFRAIETFILDVGMRIKSGNNAKKLAIEKYSLEKMGKILDQNYREIASL